MEIKRYQLKNKLLKKYIKYIWLIESNKVKISNTLLPVNNIDLIINLNSSIKYIVKNKEIIINNKPYFLGPLNNSVFIEQKGNIKVIGISFEPYGFYSLINNPIYNFNNKLIYLEDLSEKISNRLIKNLDNLNDNSAIIKKIENNLTEIISDKSIDNYHYKVFKLFLNNNYKDKIKIFSKEIGISSRQLLRIFKKYTGFSPKSLSKITRFQNISRELLNNKYENLSDLAIKYGYYDQMHFIKDCKELTGQTPLNLSKSKISVKSIAKFKNMSDFYY
ncbi:MAG: helix-turn-helix domain-containing protein [Bacillota bacterium]